MKRGARGDQRQNTWPDDFAVIEPTKPGKPVLPKPIKLKPGKSTLEYVQEQRR
ncbi:MAG: hypothetical protein NZN28_04550 [Meiothermus sp.]|uniref:hypothetical protein n=1 Tax=Meiothermus sp. TaxID=1955249 RepID=UPI0025F966C5|nr:hypothetical protein [Meiothermus sp.]MCS7067889.1 hypothetical protein [Meiothermus sp.]